MFPFVREAFAMGPAPQGGDTVGMLMQFAPIVLIFAIFYFLVLRPQQRKAKLHGEMLRALKKGDEVYTDGGIRGTVVNRVEEGQPEVTLEISPKVQIRVLRARIGDLVKAGKVEEPAKQS